MCTDIVPATLWLGSRALAGFACVAAIRGLRPSDRPVPISIPYAVSGGVVADHAGIEAQLVVTAQREAERHKVRYLELRSESLGDRLTVRDHYFGFRTTLPSEANQVLDRFPRKARAEIRKARDQFKLTARFGHGLLETFYRLYVRSLRRLGSPGHAWKFFRRLIDEFGADCLVEVVYHQDTPLAGVMSFRFRDQILPYYAGIDNRFSRMNPSNYLYFALMEHAVGLGLRIFDFGRTRRDNAGGCQFKINQGFEPEPLSYSFYSPQGHELPDLRPSNSAFSRSQDICAGSRSALPGRLAVSSAAGFPEYPSRPNQDRDQRTLHHGLISPVDRKHEARSFSLRIRVPYPPDKGDRIRSYHLLAHLARIGQVDLA